MKKSDCIMIFVCIVFLFFILGAISQGGREQARILACSASLKQIGAILTTYQADNDGYVPVMRSKWTIYISAKTSLLSLAFRNYSPELANLPFFLNPDDRWEWNQVLHYSQEYLPDFYVCPFVRGKSQAELWQNAGRVEFCPGRQRWNYKSTGRGESYSTWIWPRDAGYLFIANHCYGPEHGKNKYENLLWHAGGNPMITGIWANAPQGTADYEFLQNNPVRFSTMRRISDRTALYCAHGQIDESNYDRIISYGSHKRSNRGGTNVLFGDSHVEWVQGSQISAGN